jgi:hypothetical protein
MKRTEGADMSGGHADTMSASSGGEGLNSSPAKRTDTLSCVFSIRGVRLSGNAVLGLDPGRRATQTATSRQ